MANVNKPFGFTPIRYLSGAPYNAACTPYFKIVTLGEAMYVGDPVLVTTGSNATQSAGGEAFPIGTLKQISLAGEGSEYTTGVIVGIGPDRDNHTQQYSPTLTESIIWVADDPDLIFVGQEDSAGSENILPADVGLNCDLVLGTGSTITGRSGAMLDSTSANTTSSLQLRVLRLYDTPDNVIATSDTPAQYSQFEFMINLHTLRYTTGI